MISEIARYLNKSCLFVETILATTQDTTEKILHAVNEFNELLYDWVIPRLFKELYDIDEYEKQEEYEVELVKLSKNGYYQVTAEVDKIVSASDPVNKSYLDKSFHLDNYCFDSYPEKTLFIRLLTEHKIKKLYFTGMLTHGQSDFYIQYIDPESHTVRSYYPDFLFQKEDGCYVIVEVKGDDQFDNSVVLAKKDFAEQLASANDMTYTMIRASDVNKGDYNSVLNDD